MEEEEREQEPQEGGGCYFQLIGCKETEEGYLLFSLGLFAAW